MVEPTISTPAPYPHAKMSLCLVLPTGTDEYITLHGVKKKKKKKKKFAGVIRLWILRWVDYAVLLK